MRLFWSMLSSRRLMFTVALMLWFVLVLWVFNGIAGIISDGIDDVITSGVDSDSFVGTGNATVEIWVKPTGSAPAADAWIPNGQGIIGDVIGYWGLYRSNVLAVGDRLCAYNFLTVALTVCGTFTLDAWNHIAWTNNTSTGMVFYINGVSVGSDGSSTSIDSSAGDMLLLDLYAGATPIFNGEIADLRVFTSTLSAGEILSTASARGIMTGPMNGTGKWDFSGCGDGVSGNGVGFVDKTGNGDTLTGDDGANNTGLTCKGSSYLSWPVGAN